MARQWEGLGDRGRENHAQRKVEKGQDLASHHRREGGQGRRAETGIVERTEQKRRSYCEANQVHLAIKQNGRAFRRICINWGRRVDGNGRGRVRRK